MYERLSNLIDAANGPIEILAPIFAAMVVVFMWACGTLETHIDEVEQARIQALPVIPLENLDIERVKEVSRYMRTPL